MMRRHGKGGLIDDAAGKFAACFRAGHDPLACPSLRLLWWKLRVRFRVQGNVDTGPIVVSQWYGANASGGGQYDPCR